MRIKRLEYHDHARGWKLEPVEFSNLNLLVGVSGAGKTQILNAILNLKKIASGKSLNGAEWDITFLATDNKEYRWEGEYETKEGDFNIFGDNKEDFRIINEKLFLNRSLIVDRDRTDIKFKGTSTLKLSPFQSIIEILNQEDDIASASNSFKNLIETDYTTPASINIELARIEQLIALALAIGIDKSNDNSASDDIKDKLFFVSINSPDKFSKIKGYFNEIFPQIENVKVVSFKPKSLDKEIPGLPIILIKEKGVSNWIRETDISAGMYKTLMFIAEIYLSPEGSVILVDEFENSLGVNCIDAVTDILSERQDIQFIITSHHPYIINNIPMSCWKIVTRKGSVVTVKSAEDLNLGRSKHQAYLQLINKLERYNEELESA